MLAQRKSATNKLIEAEILLELAIKKMMSSENLDLNAMHDLIIPLIELYETNKDLWEPEKASNFDLNQKNCTAFLLESQMKRTFFTFPESLIN